VASSPAPATGAIVLLAGQDHTLWDRALIEEGQTLVRACLRRGQPGPYRHLPPNGPAGATESPYLDGPAGALASCCAFYLVARRNSLVSV
jgi:hypothetical protein